MLSLNIFFLIEFLVVVLFCLLYLYHHLEEEDFWNVETGLIMVGLVLSIALTVKQFTAVYLLMIKGIR